MAEPRSVAIWAAVIGAAGAILAAVISSQAGGGDVPRPAVPAPDPGIVDPGGTASLFVNRDSGPGGTTVHLSGEGFERGERVVLFFHTEQIGSTSANHQGRFANVAVEIPASFAPFAPQQFFLRAEGERSHLAPQTPYTITG